MDPESIRPRARFPIGLGICVLLWLASLFAVHPLGNFPLNDDWSFGQAVKRLLENHDFRPSGWTAMPLVTNVLWGSLFCLPSGFSFVALRISTLVAALFGMLGIYWLLKQSRAPEWLAVMAALLLGFNPVFYSLSCSFMTDVPFTTLTIFAAIFLLRNLRNNTDRDLFIGTAFVLLATLSRQLALAVPLAFAITSVFKHGFNRSKLWRAFFPIAIGAIALILFQHWMASTGRLSSMYYKKSGELTHALADPFHTIPEFAHNLYVCLLYLGLFLAPISFCALAAIWRTQQEKAKLIFASSLWVLLIACFCYKGRGLFMPLSTNIIKESGIGPITLRDAAILQINLLPELPPTFWKIVTLISVLGAVALLTVAGLIISDALSKMRARALSENQTAAIFNLLSAGIYLTPLLATTFFDRYLIAAIPFLAAAVVAVCPSFPKLNPKILAPSAAILVALMFYAVCGTHDYLSWNTARWTAVNDLIANQHVKPEEMDGGFEFNAMYFFNPDFDQLSAKKSWWWVQNDTYMISFGPVPGYSVLKEYHYTRWLPPGSGRVLASKKMENAESEQGTRH
jgi:hypothetical protein